MGNIFQPILELWKRLTMGQRAGLVIGFALVAAIIAGAVSYTTRPVLVNLYTGLNPKDAGQIVDDLRQAKVAFDVSGDGSTIRVPQEQVNELRLQFAADGLPTSGELGYELFDKQMLGMTDFMQRMTQHRAMEGELARTIGQLGQVENVRVHLVMPQERLFREDQKQPTASIVLQLKPGAVLSEEQVRSITYMTAFAVEGLVVENISIVDTRGNLLTGKVKRDDLAGLSSTQLDVQRAVESELEGKAMTLLENAIGPGKAQVQVTAKLNWNRLERTVENYDPDRTATLSEERQETVGDANGDGSSSSERSVTNYNVPKTVEKFVPEVGNIEKLHASVVVDGNYTNTPTTDGRDSMVYQERTAADLDKIRNLVATAIGIDTSRADEISVVSFPLTLNESVKPEPVSDGAPWWMKLVEKGVLIVALVLLFFLAKSFLTKVSRSMPALPATLEALPAGSGGGYLLVEGQGQGVSGSAATGSVSASAARTVAAGASQQAAMISGQGGEANRGPEIIVRRQNQTIEIDDTNPTAEALKHQELLKRTTDYVVKKPENATQVLRSWIFDDGIEKPLR